MSTELKDKKHLVIGRGEIGTAILLLLSEFYTNVDFKDLHATQINHQKYDVLHICIPYVDNFKQIVIDYAQEYLDDGIVIIHSTVKIGTNRELGSISSPVRGTHPNILPALKTFTKYFACVDINKASLAASYFEALGVSAIYHDNPDDTEAAKLWDTTQYGFMIVLEKWMKKWCDKHKIDFEFIYAEFNRTYNEGYAKLGVNNVQRPILTHIDGPIGGHCVIPNCKLLDSHMAKFIIYFNEEISKGELCEIEKDEESKGEVEG